MNRLTRYYAAETGKRRYLIINGYGEIITSSDSLYTCMASYMCKYDCTFDEFTAEVIEDFSSPIYDEEHDKYWTLNQLKEWYNSDADAMSRYGNFSAYLNEITGKNGTCRYI